MQPLVLIKNPTKQVLVVHQHLCKGSEWLRTSRLPAVLFSATEVPIINESTGVLLAGAGVSAMMVDKKSALVLQAGVSCLWSRMLDFMLVSLGQAYGHGDGDGDGHGDAVGLSAQLSAMNPSSAAHVCCMV